MGLFSSRERTTVATQISRVMDDDRIVNSPKVALTKALLTNEDIADSIIYELANSIGSKAELMYEYAKTNYTYGLPSGEFHQVNKGDAQVKAILEALTGKSVLIEYSRLGPANTLHMGWTKLISDYGYNPATNQIASLTASIGKPVYLADIEVEIPSAKFDKIDSRALEQWGTSAKAGYLPYLLNFNLDIANLYDSSPVVKSNTASTEQVNIKYLWENPSNPYDVFSGSAAVEASMIRDSFTIPITDFDIEREYFHVKYSTDTGTYYWMYAMGSGTYPSLDALFDAPPLLLGEYFPFIYFRLNKQRADIDINSPAYKSSKKMMKYLGMNYKQLINQIHENPDINDVEQAILMMAVPMNSQHPVDLRYLYDYFNQQYLNEGNNGQSLNMVNIRAILDSFRFNFGINITAIQDQAFKMSLSNDGIFKKRKGGSIGSRGTVTSGFGFKIQKRIVGGTGDSSDYEDTYKIPYHYFRKQISDTMYDEIEIINFQTAYHIFERYTAIGDQQDSILIVPLDRSITKTYSTPDKEELYSRSLHYVFNSRVITKLAWYQSELFTFFVMAIALTMAAFSAGQSIAAATALIAAGASLQVVILSLLIKAAIAMVVGAGLTYIAKKIGPIAAIVVAVVAAAYGLAGDGLGGINSLPFADNMLTVSSGLIKGAQEYYKDAISDIQIGFQELGNEINRVSDQISKAQDLLANDFILSPLTIIGEDPQDYYRRTMYSSTANLSAYTDPTLYYNKALSLPTLSDSFGSMLS